MAASKTVTGSCTKNNSWHTVKLTAQETSYSVSGNTSVVKVTMTVTRDAGSWYNAAAFPVTLTCAGKTYSTTKAPNFSTGTTMTIASHSFTVSHSADGSKTAAFSGSWNTTSDTTGYGCGTASASGSLALTTIPRESGVSASNGYIGHSVIITISPYASSYTHTIGWAAAGLSGTISTKTSQTSIAWTIPTSLLAQLPSDQSCTVTISCTTYSGSTQIGSAKSCTLSATVSSDEYGPQITAYTLADNNQATLALTGDGHKLIAGHNTLTYAMTATARGSAGIANRWCICGGRQAYGASGSLFNVAGAAVTLQAIDSRNYYATVADSSTLTLINYTDLAPGRVTAERPSSTSNSITLSYALKWWQGSFGATANILTMRYRIKAATTTSWDGIGWTQLLSAATVPVSYSGSTTLSGYSYQQAWDWQVEMGDKLTTKTQSGTVTKGIPVLDIGEDDIAIHAALSIQGKSLADYVVSHGISGIWRYRKWSSGIAECWGTVVCQDVVTTTAWGNLFESPNAYGGISYPFTFAQRPAQQITINQTSGTSYLIETPYGSAKSNTTMHTGYWYFARPKSTSTSNTVYVDVFVSGMIS